MNEPSGEDRQCPVCKKNFYMLDRRVWAYKYKNHKGHAWYFCSWHCLQKWRDKKINTRRYERGGT